MLSFSEMNQCSYIYIEMENLGFIPKIDSRLQTMVHFFYAGQIVAFIVLKKCLKFLLRSDAEILCRSTQAGVLSSSKPFLTGPGEPAHLSGRGSEYLPV